MSEAFRKIHPQQYFLKFVKEGVRPDGRSLRAKRPFEVNSGFATSAYGSALVRCGSSSVCAGLTGRIGPISTETIEKDVLDFIVTSPLSGAVGERAHRLEAKMDVLKDFLIRTLKDLVPDDALLLPDIGKRWYLQVDVCIVSDDGSLHDVALAAVVGCLQNTLLPAVHVSAADGVIEAAATPTIPLQLAELRVACTCGFAQGYLLLDLTKDEEDLVEKAVTVVTDGGGGFCGVIKYGGEGLSSAELAECVALAHSEGAKVKALLAPK